MVLQLKEKNGLLTLKENLMKFYLSTLFVCLFGLYLLIFEKNNVLGFVIIFGCLLFLFFPKPVKSIFDKNKGTLTITKKRIIGKKETNSYPLKKIKKIHLVKTHTKLRNVTQGRSYSCTPFCVLSNNVNIPLASHVAYNVKQKEKEELKIIKIAKSISLFINVPLEEDKKYSYAPNA